MKRIAIAALLSVFVAAPAFAADAKNNAGVNYSLDGALGIQGEFNISSMVDNAPVSVQVFYKKDSETIFGVTGDHTGIGVAGIYDLSSAIKLDKKMTPYVGLGFAKETVSVGVPGIPGLIPPSTVEASKTELYFTGGLRYALTPQISGDVSYNNLFDLTVGVNYNF